MSSQKLNQQNNLIFMHTEWTYKEEGNSLLFIAQYAASNTETANEEKIRAKLASSGNLLLSIQKRKPKHSWFDMVWL